MLVRLVLAGLSASAQKRWQELLARHPVETIALSDNRISRQAVAKQDCDLFLFARPALKLPIGDLIKALRSLPQKPDLIVLADHEDPEERAAFLAAGCLAVLNDHVEDSLLEETLVTLIERRHQQMISQLQTGQVLHQSTLGDFVSTSAAMQTFLKTVQRVVDTSTSLLIQGETGVGKERLARAIHTESARGHGPFIPVNCGAVPESLFESELFGHEQGAFTGAIRSRRGHFEMAHQGTLFLDEIGELPLHLQVKLLRALQDGTVQRVGSERATPIDVRIIAATNRDLLEDQEAKRFRRDLYYRLAIITLTIPPLRERIGDIPVLAQSYIEHFRQRLNRTARQMSTDVLQAFQHYSWPGNVRELINVIERAVLLCPGPIITLDDIPEVIANGSAHIHFALKNQRHPPRPPEWFQRPWKEVREEGLQELEREYLIGVLRACQGRIGKAAELAGMSPRSLHRKMRFYNLQKEQFMPSKDSRTDQRSSQY